jgi:hypothetical protein
MIVYLVILVLDLNLPLQVAGSQVTGIRIFGIPNFVLSSRTGNRKLVTGTRATCNL